LLDPTKCKINFKCVFLVFYLHIYIIYKLFLINLASSKLLAAQVQKPAPNFAGMAVINNDFKEIKLSDYAGKYLVLFFYPLDLNFRFIIICLYLFFFNNKPDALNIKKT